MKLLFIYNADSGLFNTLADIGHKIFSPQTYACDLCALTHGYFQEREAWRTFIDSLSCDCEFMHRDEFHRSFGADSTPLPAVFRLDGDGRRCCLSADAIAACDGLEALKTAIQHRCCAAKTAENNLEKELIK